MDSPSSREFIFRNTASQKGRRLSVSPDNSSMRHLHYGRIILDPTERLSFDTGDRETGLVCLKGSATVKVAGSTYSAWDSST